MAQRKRTAVQEHSEIGGPSGVDAVPQEIQETIVELFCGFYEKFGRAPRTNEPVFFDPDAQEPMPLQEQAAHEMWDRLADTMVDEGEMAPDAGYAMKKTGLLVTPHTEQLLTESQRREWKAALVEYQNALASPRRVKRRAYKSSLLTAGLNCSRSDRSTSLPRPASSPERKHS